MTRQAPRIAITLGDPAGIGPEVVSAALRKSTHGAARVRVYGDAAALERVAPLPRGIEVQDFASVESRPGRPDPAAAPGVVEAIRCAARDCLAGELDVLVTAPISKELLAEAGFPYPGHTELLAELCSRGRAVMLLVGGTLRVALATIHCPLREVPGRLTCGGLAETLGILDRDLRTRFGVQSPRIAVCGLNPHAGEGGRFGDEEVQVIEPAIATVRDDAIDARGPFPADSLFHRAAEGEFDAVLAMYHDQGLAPLKLHAFGRAVNVTLGLPLLRTSVDHGTAFSLAGQGRADPGSMIEAIRLGLELARRARGQA
ncbi:MAG: 4-hydroxythreonine-4-phosphate dehydrogenase PdxA [Myxococcota bacterium]